MSKSDFHLATNPRKRLGLSAGVKIYIFRANRPPPFGEQLRQVQENCASRNRERQEAVPSGPEVYSSTNSGVGRVFSPSSGGRTQQSAPTARILSQRSTASSSVVRG